MPPLPLSLPETRAEPALWAVCSLFALQGSVAVGNPSQQCPAEPGHAAFPASLSGDPGGSSFLLQPPDICLYVTAWC